MHFHKDKLHSVLHYVSLGGWFDYAYVVINCEAMIFAWTDSNIMFIIHLIILFDISPLLFECYPYVGNVQVIQSEGGLPSVVRVGVISMICNTRGEGGGGNAYSFWLLIIQLLNSKVIIIKYVLFWSWCNNDKDVIKNSAA